MIASYGSSFYFGLHNVYIYTQVNLAYLGY
jgi:hypothetical protein